MKYIIIEKYTTNYDNPIILKKDEKIIMEEETDTNGDFPNWVFCKKMDCSNSGWVPKHIIKKENNYGVITEDYSSKELNVEKGYIINGIKELNGWIWCKCENTNEIGWVMLKNIKKLE